MSTGVCDTCVRRIHSYQMISEVTPTPAASCVARNSAASEGRVTSTTPMPGRWAERQRAKLETASTMRAAAVRPFRKKSSGEASPTAAIADQGAAASNDGSASPALRTAIHRIARAVSSSRTMPSVTSTAVPTDRVDLRQSSSGPVKSNSNSAARVSSAASSRSRIRWRATARSSSGTVTATSGSSDGERTMNALGSVSAPPSNWRRKATGTMLVSRENSDAGERGASGPGQRRFRHDRADVARGIGRIEYRLDANQLQALGALRQEERRRRRSADPRARPRIARSTPPARSCRRRRQAPRSATARRRSPVRTAGGAPPDRRDRRDATCPGRAAPRARPHRGGWSARRIHPPPRPSAGHARSRGPRPAACARSPPRRWRSRRRPRGRRPRAG